MNAQPLIESARTFLFVPATRPERFVRAHESGADVVILDLEDAVAPDEKQAALDAALRWLTGVDQRPTTMVRINGSDTAWHGAEVAALAGTGAPLLLPKAESAEQVEDLHARAGRAPVVPLIETPGGVVEATSVAGAAGVVRLALGHLDLAAVLGVDPDSYEAFRCTRSQLVLASAYAGLPAPVDGVTTALDDEERLTRDVQHAVTLGFGGKLCIHPRQVGVVHDALRPADDEVAWARRVVGAAAGGGAVSLDGRMVDPPVVARAHRVLLRARVDPDTGVGSGC
ncbi:CoA ester lyase [Nocardioides sp. NBC_00850]|uniref:HpcH/HpaI aldolase/citrate lyase family protein n=1 Tax=Nocardioides sp. NBC_00850 TaxID=2976001 RepID=UPI00386C0C86|nr:CoA ester lyase [Nocardioides sp. NBC_00850]